MSVLHGDFETRSAVDLKECGLDRYCEDMSTEPMVFGYAFDDEPVEQIFPSSPFPPYLRYHIESGGIFYTHNAQFEFAIWNRICVPRYGWPVLRLKQMRCTLAMCYAMSLPGNLQDALVAVGAAEIKDAEGRRIMLQLCRPRSIDSFGKITWWDDFDKWERMLEYNRTDVVNERALLRYLAPLTEQEQHVWEMDQRINARGVAFDRVAVERAHRLMIAEKDLLNGRMQDLTNGMVPTCQSHGAILRFVQDLGVCADSVDKDTVIRLLAASGLPAQVRAVLNLRQESARSSNAKLGSMLARAGHDDRLRYTIQYHGAGTGRFTARGVQVHNFPRPQLKHVDVEIICATLHDVPVDAAREYINIMYGEPTTVIPSCLRAFLCAGPGKDLLGGDFANIEGRALAWLAGEEWKLQAFRDYDAGTGPDIYRLTYSRSFGVPLDQVSMDGEDRQVGKVEELALGYQGWVGAFQSMAADYHVIVSDERAAEIASAWRAAHPATKAYWYALEAAAVEAVGRRGVAVTVQAPGAPARVTFLFPEKSDFLLLQLPSGRVLAYAYPQAYMRERTFPNGKIESKPAVQFMGWDGEKKLWCMMHAYGGLWAENIDQALCRDLLVGGMLRAEAAGLPVVLHVHDDTVVEVAESDPITPKEYAAILTQPEPWAAGLPVVVPNPWRRKRYGK